MLSWWQKNHLCLQLALATQLDVQTLQQEVSKTVSFWSNPHAFIKRKCRLPGGISCPWPTPPTFCHPRFFLSTPDSDDQTSRCPSPIFQKSYRRKISKNKTTHVKGDAMTTILKTILTTILTTTLTTTLTTNLDDQFWRPALTTSLDNLDNVKNVCQISKTWISHSPIWIQETLAHLKMYSTSRAISSKIECSSKNQHHSHHEWPGEKKLMGEHRKRVQHPLVKSWTRISKGSSEGPTSMWWRTLCKGAIENITL